MCICDVHKVESIERDSCLPAVVLLEAAGFFWSCQVTNYKKDSGQEQSLKSEETGAT